jgi:aspartyl-tRNA(Asn)/glutamyl-tRNA(Gln) amidotransferase subunit B
LSYEAVIGMEVHVELQTASKMFCACDADHFQQPANTHICPVCTAQPGALPVINGRALELTAMTGLALNCHIESHNVFARKNYVYPDLPKGYQVSQYEFPICREGWVEVDDGAKRIGVVRVHLEEDTGKLVHERGASLVDYNRAGVPLMEIVTDASIRSADEAYQYLQKIRQVVRYLGASSGDMEKGAMRCEANISVRPVGSEPFGTKVEVKNLNSFRAVRNAIDYEIKRQIQVITNGGQVHQVTMGWDENTGVTRQQRSKETSEDYRYFPEPDLLDIDLDQAWMERVGSEIPELPEAKAARFAQAYGLGQQDIALLLEDRQIADYFERGAVVQGADTKLLSNWVTVELFRRMKEDDTEIDKVKITPESLVELIGLVKDKTLNQTAAKEVFGVLWEKGGNPGPVVEERGLKQISNSDELSEQVDQVLAANQDAIDKIKAGNDKPVKFLMGQVMRATRGKANPQLVEELIRTKTGV